MSHPFHSIESAEDRVIRITTELLTTHVASRSERGVDAPLNDQDMARLKALAILKNGPYGETVTHLIQVAFPEWGQKRPVEETAPVEGEA